MIAEEEAREKVLEKIQVRASRRVSLSHALNCFAAEDYFSSLPLPNFDNSAMDGYAVAASSCGLEKTAACNRRTTGCVRSTTSRFCR